MKDNNEFNLTGSEIYIIPVILFIILYIAYSFKYFPISNKLIAIYVSLVFLIFSVYFHDMFVHSKILQSAKKIKLDKLEDDVENGDMILFSSNLYGNTAYLIYRTFGTFLLGERWSHVGIIYKDKKDVYVMEISDSQSGVVRMTSLKVLLRNYDGIFGIDKCNKKISSTSLMKSYNKFKHMKFDCYHASVWFGHKKHYPYDVATMNCLDFAQALQIDNKIISKPQRAIGRSNDLSTRVKDLTLYHIVN